MTIWKYSLKLCYTSTTFLLSLSALFALHSACMPTAPPPTENITITVPKGTRLQGSDLQTLCTPSKWTDVAKFLLANYIAHAATLKSLPGESTSSVLRNIVCSLLFPVSGVIRGVKAICQCATFAKTPLEAAAKANALCMVVRTSEWKPEHGDIVKIVNVREPQKKPWWREDGRSDSRAERVEAGVRLRLAKANRLLNRLFSFLTRIWQTIEDGDVSDVPAYIVQSRAVAMGHPIRDLAFQPSSSGWDPRGRIVHGVCQLPSGYALYTVPPGSHVVELDTDQESGEGQPGKIQPDGKDTTDNKDKGDNRDQGDGKAMATSLRSRSKTQISSKWASRQRSLNDSHSSTTQLSSVNNFAKGLIAIFQTFYASFTLYHARGDQVQHYGYAAFGLTVVPYIVMSIINLASTVLTPDYSVMYLVASEAMEEAKRREDAKFEGVVGRILTTTTSTEISKTVRFDLNSDGKMAVLAIGSDNELTKFDEEAEMDMGKPRIDPWTGSLSVIPFRQPCRIISRSSELLRLRPPGRGPLLASWAVALIPIAVNGPYHIFNPVRVPSRSVCGQ